MGPSAIAKALLTMLVQASTTPLILSVLLGSRGQFLLSLAAFVGSFCIGR